VTKPIRRKIKPARNVTIPQKDLDFIREGLDLLAGFAETADLSLDEIQAADARTARSARALLKPVLARHSESIHRLIADMDRRLDNLDTLIERDRPAPARAARRTPASARRAAG
jgi:hypothetical protein